MELPLSTLEIVAVVVGLVILTVRIKIVAGLTKVEASNEVSALQRLRDWFAGRGKILMLMIAMSMAASSCSFLESVGFDRLIGSAVDGLIPSDSIYIDYDGAYIELEYYRDIDTTLPGGEFWVRWMHHDSTVLIEYLPHDTTLKRD